MNRIDLIDLLNEERFTPFRIATTGGFNVSIASQEDRRNVLAGKTRLVILDAAGFFTTLPYHVIEQITELQPL